MALLERLNQARMLRTRSEGIIIPRLARFMDSMNDFPDLHQPGRLYLSQMPGFCPRRKRLLDLYPEAKDRFTPPARFSMDIGTWIHAGMQNEYFGPMRILWGRWRCRVCGKIITGFMPKEQCACSVAACERRCLWPEKTPRDCAICRFCNYEYVETSIWFEATRIAGRADGDLRLEKRMALEIKTVGSRKFDALRRPEPKHVTQTNLVMKGLDVDEGLLLYLDRDAWDREFLRAKEFQVWYNDAEVSNAFVMARKYWAAFERRQLVTRLCGNDKDDFGKWCPVKKICWDPSMDRQHGVVEIMDYDED